MRRLRRGRLPGWVLRAALTWMVCVVAINLGVRAAGGDPHLLSPRFLAEKTTALLMLSAHTVRHLGACEHEDLQRTVTEAARRNRVPVKLALSVAGVESSFSPHAVSRTGAMGLMQLMPATAEDLGVSDPFSPQDNADGATRYLRFLLDRYRGNRRRAIWAYNAGPGRIPRRGPVDLPAETRAYGARIDL